MAVNVLEDASELYGRTADHTAQALALVAIQLVYLTTEVQEGAGATSHVAGSARKIQEALENMARSGGQVG